MYMLDVTFDLRNGKHGAIPEGPHRIVLKGMQRLMPEQQGLLRQTIVRHRLDVDFNEAFESDTAHTRRLFDILKQFVQESSTLRPRYMQQWIGWLTIVFMFAMPVYVAYHFSSWIEGAWISPGIEHLKSVWHIDQDVIETILFGDYGILTLGVYSLVWALPVVVMISLATTLVDQTGMKGYVTWSISPVMQRIGLTGQDMIPLIEGFGCNAAAVSHAYSHCSRCTCERCVSLISFGTACSYQIGATLSLFNAAHKMYLFAPYLIIVFLGGVLHNRLWYRKRGEMNAIAVPTQHVVQKPNVKDVCCRTFDSLKMFLKQAMPLFIGVCLCVSLLSLTPILNGLSRLFQPLLSLLHIPDTMAPGILFSMIRKDGMLLFNLDHGQVIQQMGSSQLLLLVFFCSTFTACSVTMLMIMKHGGFKEGVKLIGRQMVTAIICVVAVSSVLRVAGIL